VFFSFILSSVGRGGATNRHALWGRGTEKAGWGDFEIKPEKLLSTLLEILDRGNTAEVKKVKDGILVLEVKRETRLRDGMN